MNEEDAKLATLEEKSKAHTALAIRVMWGRAASTRNWLAASIQLSLARAGAHGERSGCGLYLGTSDLVKGSWTRC